MNSKIKRAFALTTSLTAFSLFTACGNVARTKEIKTELTQTQVVLENNVTENENYIYFLNKFTSGFTVPGLFEGVIPQGICFDEDDGVFIISGYYEDAKYPSVLMTVSKDGKFKGYYLLKDTDGTDYSGHAGGIGYSDGTVYVTSESECRTLSASFLKTPSGSTVKFGSRFKLNTKGSFAAVCDNILWTGDFTESSAGEREAAENVTTLTSGETFYAYCEGYVLKDGLPDPQKINSDNTGYIPDFILAVPEQVQGMSVTSAGDFIFSTSYGRKNDSVLYVFGDVFEKERVDTAKIDGNEVDVFALSSDLLKKTITAPPMSESIACTGDSYYVLFESGASKYRSHGGKYPTDTVWGAYFE